MIELDELDCEWFDRLYREDFHGKPTLETRAGMLRRLCVGYSDRQITDFKKAIGHGLHLMKQECKPSLVITVYSLITALSMSEQVSSSEINRYVSDYRQVLASRCSHIQQNFE